MDDLPQDVLQFLAVHIASVAQLEILLLLMTNPKKTWSPEEIARELRIEAAGARQPLMLLAASGLVKEHGAGRFGYAPANGELESAVMSVAQAYLLRRVTVIGAIFAKPLGMNSSESLKAFSDAFKLRKEPPHGS